MRQWESLNLRVGIITLASPKSDQLVPGAADLETECLGVRRARHSLRPLARIFRQVPDVPILVFGFELGVATGILKLLRLVRNRIIYREGSNPDYRVPRSRRWLYRSSIGAHDLVIAQNSYIYGRLCALGIRSEKLCIISNPVCSNSDGPSPAPIGAGYNVISIGRLDPVKGVERLLSAFAAALEHMPDLTLTIAGDGPERKSLEEQTLRLRIANRVSFLGWVEQTRPLYANADLLLLSSYREGQPNVVLEALEMGCPVLAAGGPTVKELLVGLGLADCYLDASDFGSSLLQRITAIRLGGRARFGVAATRIRKEYSVEKIAAYYLAACLRSNRSRPDAKDV